MFHWDTRLIMVINPSGSIGIIGAGRIEGIGEEILARPLVGGLRNFTFIESGHAGVVEADGTIQLCLASGEDLTITFPPPITGENPPANQPVCPTCGLRHPGTQVHQ